MRIIQIIVCLLLLSASAEMHGQTKKVVRQKQVPKQQVPVTTEKSRGSQYSFQSIRWANPFKEGLSRVEGKGMWAFGFVDKTGKIVIRKPSQAYLYSDFSEGYALVVDNKDNYGYIDKTGKIVIACRWKYAEKFSEGLAKFKDANEKYGFIDKKGNLVIPCKWKAASSFSEGLAKVAFDDGSHGFIDKTGAIVIHFKKKVMSYWPTDFKEGIATYRGKFIDKEGKEIPCPFEACSGFSEGLAMVSDGNNQYGFVDKSFKLVIPCKWKYNSEMVFHDGRARIRDKEGRCGFIDKSGKIVIPCKWHDAESFCEGLALVKDEDGKYGFIDIEGNVISPCKWNFAHSFSEGLAWVKDSRDNWHIIDRAGRIVK